MAGGKAAKAGNGTDDAPAPRRAPGRAPGSPKVPGSGRRKGVPSAMGKEARLFLAAHSGYLDTICRVCAGKAVKMSGPTGKKVWFHPEWKDRRWAIELVASKLLPTMAASELSGPEGERLLPTNLAMTDKELARRVALILTQADGTDALAALTEGRDGSTPRRAEADDVAGSSAPRSGTSAAARNNGKTPPGGPLSAGRSPRWGATGTI